VTSVQEFKQLHHTPSRILVKEYLQLKNSLRFFVLSGTREP